LRIGLKNKDGYIQYIMVHRLIALCFVENPNNYKFINHKDCNKSNNVYTNLEWCTGQQNINHAIIHNRHGGNFKLTIEQIKEIRRSDLKNNQIWSNVK
jgi:hypothetical protein